MREADCMKRYLIYREKPISTLLFENGQKKVYSV